MLKENVYWTLDCTGCGEVFRQSQPSAQFQLAQARLAGWAADEKNQVCPRCQKILANLNHIVFIAEDVPA